MLNGWLGNEHELTVGKVELIIKRRYTYISISDTDFVHVEFASTTLPVISKIILHPALYFINEVSPFTILLIKEPYLFKKKK